MPGTLFVVATPIGNLEDLTFRALRTLKDVDLVVAEDTRRTAKLLTHYGLSKPLASLHAHNERRSIPALIQRLLAGQSLALVSDAGTPAIADPGEHLVRAARDHSIKVTPVPGPSSITAALSASGFPADEFAFMGFAPRSGKERERWFGRLAAEPRTIVFFEVPHRIARTLSELTMVCINRPIIIHRELTKLYEESIIYPNKSVPSRGEFVLVIGPPLDKPPVRDGARPGGRDDMELLRAFEALEASGWFTSNRALEIVSAAFGLDTSSTRKRIKKTKILVKQQSQTSS